jgi:hypothetical protein
VSVGGGVLEGVQVKKGVGVNEGEAVGVSGVTLGRIGGVQEGLGGAEGDGVSVGEGLAVGVGSAPMRSERLTRISPLQ